MFTSNLLFGQFEEDEISFLVRERLEMEENDFENKTQGKRTRDEMHSIYRDYIVTPKNEALNSILQITGKKFRSNLRNTRSGTRREAPCARFFEDPKRSQNCREFERFRTRSRPRRIHFHAKPDSPTVTFSSSSYKKKNTP